MDDVEIFQKVYEHSNDNWNSLYVKFLKNNPNLSGYSRTEQKYILDLLLIAHNYKIFAEQSVMIAKDEKAKVINYKEQNP